MTMYVLFPVFEMTVFFQQESHLGPTSCSQKSSCRRGRGTALGERDLVHLIALAYMSQLWLSCGTTSGNTDLI